jgi:indolepyruvate ferredoxin oxidoreductase
MGEADLVIGCDAIVTASDECGSRMQPGHTRVVVNSAETPTAAFIKDPNWRFPGASAEADIRAAAGEHVSLVDANRFAVALMGDAIYTNPFVLGYAWQKGWLPLLHESLVRAIELNAVQVEKNLAAFEWGRRAAHDLAAVTRLAHGTQTQDGAAPGKIITLHTPKALDTLIDKRLDYLAKYQNTAYAARYGRLVAEVRAAEAALGASDFLLTEAVARNLHKLMAYKDEYEVARLYADPAFLEKVKSSFEGDWKIKFHLAPPALSKKDAHGRSPQIPARHGDGSVRADGRKEDGAGVDRRVRGARPGTDRPIDDAEAAAGHRVGEPAGFDARVWPHQGQQRQGGEGEVGKAAGAVARS